MKTLNTFSNANDEEDVTKSELIDALLGFTPDAMVRKVFVTLCDSFYPYTGLSQIERWWRPASHVNNWGLFELDFDYWLPMGSPEWCEQNGIELSQLTNTVSLLKTQGLIYERLYMYRQSLRLCFNLNIDELYRRFKVHHQT